MQPGKNIILIHGWGASAQKLDPLASELEKLGWRTLVLKLPGFDLEPPRKVWGVKEYADFVLSKAKKQFNTENFTVFGHSFGGRIAINIGSHEEKALTGVVLCSTSGISRGKLSKRLVFFLLAKIGKILLVFPPAADLWRRLLYKLAREHDYEKTNAVMKETFKKVIADNYRQLISLIQSPTLVLWGKEDKMTPVNDAYFISKRLPNGKLVLFEDQGHKLPYEKPYELAQEINQWNQTI